MIADSLTIRFATPADAVALHMLAALDSALAPSGKVVVAEVDGELWAALDVESGAVIADPFRPSGELLDLLRLRVERLAERPARQRRRRLRPRLAS
jgi:hypothetical protein